MLKRLSHCRSLVDAAPFLVALQLRAHGAHFTDRVTVAEAFLTGTETAEARALRRAILAILIARGDFQDSQPWFFSQQTAALLLR